MHTDLAGLTLLPVDFRFDDVAAALVAGGHDPGRPALFICEGLLVYLEQDAIVELLAGLPSGAGGTSLAASLAIHPDGIDSEWVRERANAARANGLTEPWLTILPAAGHLDLLATAGWQVVECRDDATFDTGAVPHRSLCVVARPGPGPRRCAPPGH